MRGLKVLIALGFLAALMVWATVPAEETQETQPSQKIEITCERNYITVKPISFQLSQFSNEKAKWHFVGSGPKSVGACIVGDSPLSKSLKKIEISLNIPAWASSKYPKLLNLTYPTEPWQDGVDYEIEGEIGDKQLEEDEIRIEYSIRFLSGNAELLLERKGFEMKVIPAIECAVHPGSAKNKDGDYNTITQALNDTARQCEKVVVEPGIYEDNPTIEPRLRRLAIEASGEERKPIIKAQQGREMNQIFFLKKASNVTIDGLNITGGNIGILIQRSHNIVIRNIRAFSNEEAGIRVTQSGERGAITLKEIEAYDNGKAANRERKGGIVIINSSVTIENSTVHDNQVSGITIIDVPQEQKVIVSKTIVKNNKGDGIFIKDAPVDLQENSIFQNGKNQEKPGCGVRAEGYPPPIDSLSRSNLIIANGPDPSSYINRVNEYNICPPNFDTTRAIRKPSIDIPQNIETLQKAIYEVEPIRNSREDPIYEIIIRGEVIKLEKPLCVDRSVTIRSILPTTLHPSETSKPIIDIGSQECPLLEDLPTHIKIQGPIEGSLILDGINKASAGFQVGTRHINPKGKVSLKVTLQNIVIQNNEIGIKASTENNKEHSLIVQFLGLTPPQDAACTIALSRPNPPTDHPAQVQNNKEGILVNLSKEASVQIEVTNSVIKRNSGNGLKLVSERTEKPSLKDLQIQKVWIQENGGMGLAVESQGQGDAEIEIQDARFWGNTGGGVLLKAADGAQLKSDLTNIDIRKNKSFGIEIAGAVNAILKADVPESNPTQLGHSCWIGENFGPGIYIHGPTTGSKRASVTVEKLFVFRNGFESFEDKRGGTPKLRKGKELVGPDGIFASGLVNLIARNNLIGLYTTELGIKSGQTGNAGVGILLYDIGLANQQRSTLTAEIIGNHIKMNRKWGVAYISQGCLEDIPVNYRVDNAQVQVTGSANEILENGGDLSFEELKYGHEKQICPNIPKLRALGEP